VYVRGTLRSYSTYLGLDPDKVVAAYGAAVEATPELADEAGEVPPPVQPKPIRKLHRSANWKLAFLVAVVLLVAFGAAGLLSGDQPTPDATAAPATPPSESAPLQDTSLAYVYLEATKRVQARVIADGTELFSDVLKPGKPQQVTASTLVRVWLERGGDVQITVNGHDLGEPGVPEREFVASFTPRDYRETPSPAA
jgi:cytoskeleton protein RodZ